MPTWIRLEKRLDEVNSVIGESLELEKIPELLKELKLLEADTCKCITTKIEWPSNVQQRQFSVLVKITQSTWDLLNCNPLIPLPAKQNLYSLTLVTLRTLGQLFSSTNCSVVEDCTSLLIEFIDKTVFKKILYSSDLVIIAVHLWVTVQRKFLDKTYTDLINMIEEKQFPESIKLACMNSLVTEYSDPSLICFIYEIDSTFFLHPHEMPHHSELEISVIKAKYCLQLCLSLGKLAGQLSPEVEERLFDCAYSYLSDRLETSVDIIRILSFDSLRHLLLYDLNYREGELGKQLLANINTYLNDYQGSFFRTICIVVEVIGVEKSLECCPNLVDYCVKFLEDRNDVPSFLVELVARLSSYNLVNFFNKLTQCHSKASLRVMDAIIPKLSKKDPLLIKRLVNLGLLSDLNVDLKFKLKLLHLYNSSPGCKPLQTQELLRESIFHYDESTRLQALGVMIDCSKLSTPLPTGQLELIKESLNIGLTIQEPCNRQRFLVLMDKLFKRIKCSLEYSIRDGKTKDLHEQYREFIVNVLEVCLTSLYIDGYFARRTLALELISMILSNLSDSKNFQTQDIFSSFNSNNSIYYTLMTCLIEDSLEETKQLCINLILDLVKQNVIILNPEEISLIRKKAFEMLTSINPLDVLSASYVFRCLARLISLDELDKKIAIHIDLLNLLTDQVKQAVNETRTSILDGAVYNPIHSRLSSIHSLIESLDSNCFALRKSDWRKLFQNVMTICFESSEVVSCIVCNDSPEGFLPMDLKPLDNEMVSKIMGKDCSSPVINLQIEKRRDITSQMLLIFGWKTIKEASLILGQLCEKIDHRASSEPGEILTCDDVELILNYFVHHLKELKHRGAFEQAYIGFSMVVKSLWKNNCHCLQVVESLLKDIILDLADESSGGNSGRKCITRRSAGLPFVTQAIVSSEPKENRNKLLHYVVTNLIQICSTSSAQDWQKVHCLNVLRALMKDQRLGERVDPFIEDSLKLCIRHFSYPSYSVSNSASILFSALMVRIFGVNRSREVNHKKNAMSARHFFLRFSSLESFIVDNINKLSGHHILPIILIILRLWPSIREADCHLLKFMEPLRTLCFQSNVAKIRELSAQALAQIMSCDEALIQDNLTQVCSELVNHAQLSHNHQDGLIKLLYYFLKSHVKQIALKGSSNQLIAYLTKLMQNLLSSSIENSETKSYYIYSHFVLSVEILLKEQLIILEDQLVCDLHKLSTLLLLQYQANPKNNHFACSQDFFVKLIYFSLHYSPIDVTDKILTMILSSKLPMEMTHFRTVVFSFLSKTLKKDELPLEKIIRSEIMSDFELNIPQNDDDFRQNVIEPSKVMELVLHCPELSSLLSNNLKNYQPQRNLQQFLFILHSVINHLDSNCLTNQKQLFDKCLTLFDELQPTCVNEDTLALFYLVLSDIWFHIICSSHDFDQHHRRFEKFCSTIVTICSIDRNDLSRKIAVVILSKLLPTFITNEKVGSINHLNSIAFLWRCLPNLLQDNEPDIRKFTAKLLHNLTSLYPISQESKRGPLLDCSFSFLFQLYINHQQKEQLRRILFDLISNQQSILDYEDESERFFDKSKINFIEDPIQIMMITKTFLIQLIDGVDCSFFHLAVASNEEVTQESGNKTISNSNSLMDYYTRFKSNIKLMKQAFLQKISNSNLNLDIYKSLFIIQLWIQSNSLCDSCSQVRKTIKEEIFQEFYEQQISFGTAQEIRLLRSLLAE